MPKFFSHFVLNMFIYQTNRKGKIPPLKLPLSRGIFLNSIRLVCYETGCGSEMGPWPSPSYSQKSDSVIIFLRTRAPDLCTPLDLLTKHFLLSPPHKNHLRKGSSMQGARFLPAVATVAVRGTGTQMSAGEDQFSCGPHGMAVVRAQHTVPGTHM